LTSIGYSWDNGWDWTWARAMDEKSNNAVNEIVKKNKKRGFKNPTDNTPCLFIFHLLIFKAIGSERWDGGIR